MATLRMGSRGPEVTRLQEALNTELTPSPGLEPNGDFGPLTNRAVRLFQRDNWLVIDGEIGPCTRNALMGTEAYLPILHELRFIPQPTDATCWAASTAMVTRSAVWAVVARTPTDLLLPGGSLKNFTGTAELMNGSTRFAAAHGLRFVPPSSWPPTALHSMLSSGPLIFDMLWDARSYIDGCDSAGHMIVIVGIRGDGNSSGLGTTLRVLDPWPPNRGRCYSVGYAKWILEIPTRTYRIFHKS